MAQLLVASRPGRTTAHRGGAHGTAGPPTGRPLPPCAAGEEDYLASHDDGLRPDPCHLVWQVNKILQQSHGAGVSARFRRFVNESDSPAGRAGGGLFKMPLSLAEESRSPAG